MRVQQLATLPTLGMLARISDLEELERFCDYLNGKALTVTPEFSALFRQKAHDVGMNLDIANAHLGYFEDEPVARTITSEARPFLDGTSAFPTYDENLPVPPGGA